MRRAYANLVATAKDWDLWKAMDNVAFDLAMNLAQTPDNIQYWNQQANTWQPARPLPDANGRGFWQDRLGTTHHEAGTLFIGQAGVSGTDQDGASMTSRTPTWLVPLCFLPLAPRTRP